MEQFSEQATVDQEVSIRNRRTALATVSIGVFMTLCIGTVTLLIVGFLCIDAKFCFVEYESFQSDFPNRGVSGKSFRKPVLLKQKDPEPVRTIRPLIDRLQQAVVVITTPKPKDNTQSTISNPKIKQQHKDTTHGAGINPSIKHEQRSDKKATTPFPTSREGDNKHGTVATPKAGQQHQAKSKATTSIFMESTERKQTDENTTHGATPSPTTKQQQLGVNKATTPFATTPADDGATATPFNPSTKSHRQDNKHGTVATPKARQQHRAFMESTERKQTDTTHGTTPSPTTKQQQLGDNKATTPFATTPADDGATATPFNPATKSQRQDNKHGTITTPKARQQYRAFMESTERKQTDTMHGATPSPTTKQQQLGDKKATTPFATTPADDKTHATVANPTTSELHRAKSMVTTSILIEPIEHTDTMDGISSSPTTKQKQDADSCWETYSGVCFKFNEPCPYDVSSRNQAICRRKYSCCVPRERKIKAPVARSNCGQLPPSRARIFGRKKTRQWPFMASLQVGGAHVCGATIISPTFVITAGHCMTNRVAGEISVVTGTRVLGRIGANERRYTVKAIVMSGNRSEDDLALLRVEPEMEMDDWRQPVCLPTLADDFNAEDEETDVCLEVGWGGKGSSRLKHHMQMVAHYLLPSYRCSGNDEDNSNDICTLAISSNVCNTDIGGPLVGKRDNRYVLVGVSSNHENTCSDEKEPTQFLNVTAYLPWITEVVKDLPTNSE